MPEPMALFRWSASHPISSLLYALLEQAGSHFRALAIHRGAQMCRIQVSVRSTYRL